MKYACRNSVIRYSVNICDAHSLTCWKQNESNVNSVILRKSINIKPHYRRLTSLTWWLKPTQHIVPRDDAVVEHLSPTLGRPPTNVARAGFDSSDSVSKCGLGLLLVLVLAPRGFSPGTPVLPSPQKSTSKF